MYFSSFFCCCCCLRLSVVMLIWWWHWRHFWSTPSGFQSCWSSVPWNELISLQFAHSDRQTLSCDDALIRILGYINSCLFILFNRWLFRSFLVQRSRDTSPAGYGADRLWAFISDKNGIPVADITRLGLTYSFIHFDSKSIERWRFASTSPHYIHSDFRWHRITLVECCRFAPPHSHVATHST